MGDEVDFALTASASFGSASSHRPLSTKLTLWVVAESLEATSSRPNAILMVEQGARFEAFILLEILISKLPRDRYLLLRATPQILRIVTT